MAAPRALPVLLLGFLVAICHVSPAEGTTMVPADRAALLAVRAQWGGGVALRGWGGEGADRCEDWEGVACTDQGHVTRLDLARTPLTGTISEAIGNLTSLTFVDFQQAFLHGAIPESIGKLVNLSHLDLHYNALTNIPRAIGNLRKLTYLDLSNNVLNGSIPNAIGNLIHLTHLKLYSNRLNGSIPNSIGKMVSLNILWLFENQLSGSVPESICSLTNLTSLSVNTNRLTGKIPKAIGNLNKLEGLWFHENEMSGDIPKSIDLLKGLYTLNLRNNYFTGSMSLASTVLAYVDAEMNFLSGPINMTRNGRPLCSYVANNCIFAYNTTAGCSKNQTQRSPEACAAFCNSGGGGGGGEGEGEGEGACGEGGACDPKTSTCVCDAGYVRKGNTCRSAGPPVRPPPRRLAPPPSYHRSRALPSRPMRPPPPSI